MASHNGVKKGRKRGVSPIAVAVIVLLVAIIAIIIVSFATKLVSAESKGDVLELSVEWTAEQNSDDDYAKLVVNLYVNFNDMKVTTRKDNTLTVNGKTVKFESGNISGTSTKTQKKLLRNIPVGVEIYTNIEQIVLMLFAYFIFLYLPCFV